MRSDSTSQVTFRLRPSAAARELKALTRVRSPSAEATMRSNNLGGQGPGPDLCLSEPGHEKCGFYDLNVTHPYHEKMGASLHSSMPAALADACRIPSGASLRQFSAMS